MVFAIILGSLVSRAMMSVGMFLFGFNALRGAQPREWLKQKWWLIGLCWIAMYALSWFWSDDKHIWGQHLEVKLPFLLLPLAFPFLPAFSRRQLQFFTLSTGILLLSGAIYSVYPLIGNVNKYVQEYSMSHVLRTPYGEHIRFSLSIALYIVWAVWSWPRWPARSFRILLFIIIALLVIYLHVLAAKSGLLSLYLFFTFWAVYLSRRRILLGLGILVSLVLCFYLATQTIPTFHTRLGYIRHVYQRYQVGDMSTEYGDLGRLVSYDVAGKVILAHPWLGVGSGDLNSAMKEGYRQWYPATRPENILVPHNQFLVVALACGIPTALFFTYWVFMPLAWIRRNRDGFFFFVVWLILLVQLMIEPALEVQFGVFVYLFYLLWQRHNALGTLTK